MNNTCLLNNWIWAAIAWLVLVSVLFCLPGSALPAAGWMGAIQLDKWVHIGIFSVLCFLWSRALNLNKTFSLMLLAVVAIIYGFGVEVVQDRLIVNRSFDLYDLMADGVGIALGLVALKYIKK